jgi:hypothetical protein
MMKQFKSVVSAAFSNAPAASSASLLSPMPAHPRDSNLFLAHLW